MAAFSLGSAAASSPTTTTLNATTASSILGAPINFNATVVPSTASGFVTFFDGQAILSSKPLAAGQASLTTTLLGVGQHSITAIYGGDGLDAESVSGAVLESIHSVPANGLVAGVTMPAQANGLSIAVSDFNGDGLPDVAATSSSGVVVLLGELNARFAAQKVLSAVPNASVVVAGDFNQDGRQDLVAANGSGFLAMMPGNGDGTFQPPVSISSNSPCYALEVADFNGDGVPDLACAEIGGLVTFLGSATGAFQGPFENNAGIPHGGIALGDFNGDGRTDLAVGASAGGIQVLLGNGDGTFGAATAYATNGTVANIVAADLNKDGKVDLVAFAGSATVLFGNGDGTFEVGAAYGDGTALGGATGDLDGDGNLDLVLSGPTGLISLTGVGDGTFGGPVYYSTVDRPVTSLAVADLNADGRTDVIYLGNSDVDVELGASTSPCSTTAPTAIALDSISQTATLQVTATSPSCVWTVSSFAPWIQAVASGSVGSGNVAITVEDNSDQSDRSSTILVGEQVITINQEDTQQVFTDVPPGTYYFDAVNELSEHSITSGCGTNLYCPQEVVTRDQMAVFIVRMVYNDAPFSYSPTPYFTDVPANYWAFSYIQKLYELGITTGCGPALYCPTLAVARDQMAVFIIRARYGSTTQFDYPQTPFFTDVSQSEFAFPWIQRLRMDSITTGCQPNLYCPSNSVIRGDMAIFLMRGGLNQLLPPGTPSISSVTPNTLVVGTTATMAITGVNTNWVQGTTTLNPIPGVTIQNLTVNSAAQMTVQLTASASASPQPVSLLAITGAPPGNEEAVLPNSLILEPANAVPTVTAVGSEPAYVFGLPYPVIDVNILGTGFVEGATVTYCTFPYGIPPECTENITPTINNWNSISLNDIYIPDGEYEFYVQTTAGISNPSPLTPIVEF